MGCGGSVQVWQDGPCYLASSGDSLISPLKRIQTSATISSEKMLGLPGSFLAPVLGSQTTKAARFMAMFQERSYFTYR